MSGRGRKGAAEVFMFLKQSKEMKIPFCLSSSDRRGRGRKALKEKKTQEERKERKENCFPLSWQGGDWYNNYVQIWERRGRRKTRWDWLCFRFSIKAGAEAGANYRGCGGGLSRPHTFRYQLQVSNAKITSKELQITIRRIWDTS